VWQGGIREDSPYADLPIFWYRPINRSQSSLGVEVWSVMKTEKAFSKNGFYMFVLESNLMLHEHVARRGGQFLSNWLVGTPGNQSLQVLDLACGGTPIAISKILETCSAWTFHYTGIDINPDQIAAAKTFQFPTNVSGASFIEGNAWDLFSLPLRDQYDIVFIGMNLHHGSPEEIYCLLLQVATKLSDKAVLINHDFYRPVDLPYLRRPNVNPKDASESFAMIDDERLAKLDLKVSDVVTEQEIGQTDWRSGFIQRYVAALHEKGAPESGIEEVVTHVMSRDFPLSVSEMSVLAGKAGFEMTLLDLDATDQPLGQYFSLVGATCHRE